MSDLVRKPFRSVQRSATLVINERSAELIRQGRRVFRFGLGQSPFPVPGEVVAALQENAAEKDYLPVQGLPGLRQAVAAHHAREDGLECHAEQVVIGPGSKELLFLLQLVLDPCPDPDVVKHGTTCYRGWKRLDRLVQSSAEPVYPD